MPGRGTYTRNFVDLDTVKRVEIVRGPASALYGSDALGGVVNYILKDPTDYLTEGRDTYLSGRVGYNGSDNSTFGTALGAARMGDSELMLLYTRRQGQETQANGSIDPNSQSYWGNSLLARWLLHPTDVDTIRVTGEYMSLQTRTDLRTELVNTPGAMVLRSDADDTTQRGWGAINWVHDAPVGFIDRVQTRLSYSMLDRSEKADQLRSTSVSLPAVTNRQRLSDFGYNQNILSGDLQMSSAGTWGNSSHLFTYGTTVDYTTTSRPRDRTEINLLTGVGTKTVAGETYPNKNFPDTNTVQVGVYVQDEIKIGALDLTPALRVEYYNLQPKSDADFIRSSGGSLVVNAVSEVAFAPKFGALYHLDETYSVYGQYSTGFRAPPYDNVNFGYTNRAFGYQILPASNLKSETSHGGEVGFRGTYPDGAFQLNSFFTSYSNFIDTKVVGNAGGLIQYSYVNVSSVNIWGAEASGNWRVTPEWTVRSAFAWAQGEDADTGVPVDSVDPIKLVVGLAWQNSWGLGTEAVLTQAWRHGRVSSDSYFKAPSYTVLDLLAHYDVNPNFSINGGIFNVTDAKYFNTQDVIGLAASSTQRDLYAQPGRYFAMNVVLRW